MRFSTPLDSYQKTICEAALQEANAPFSLQDPESFRAKVKWLWANYQARLEQEPPLVYRPFHRVDRLLYQRSREEYIDDPNLPDARRVRLVHGLDRLNKIAGTYSWFFSALELVLQNLPPGEVSVLDIGSGYGAVPIRLSKAKFPLHRLKITGSDIEPAYISHAQQSAKEQNADVQFRLLDALSLDRLEERFDIIICTQTVHHFPPEFVAELLARAHQNARYAVLFFDARRAVLPLWGASIGNFLVNADWMLSHDGFVSVRRMYSPPEFEMLAKASGLENVTACNFGPFHVLLEVR